MKYNDLKTGGRTSETMIQLQFNYKQYALIFLGKAFYLHTTLSL